MRRLYGLGAAILLSACSLAPGNSSPLVREAMVRLAPFTTYQILDGALRMVSETTADKDMKVRHSADGARNFTLTYVKDRRDVMVHRLHLEDLGGGQTKLTQTIELAPAATEDDKRRFAGIRRQMGDRVDQLAAMLNSNTLAQMTASGTGGAGSFDMGGSVTRAPEAPAAGTAPVMSTEPVMDTTPGSHSL